MSSEASKSGGVGSLRAEHPGCMSTPAPRTCSSCSRGSLIAGALTSRPHVHGHCRRLNRANERRGRVPGSQVEASAQASFLLDLSAPLRDQRQQEETDHATLKNL